MLSNIFTKPINCKTFLMRKNDLECTFKMMVHHLNVECQEILLSMMGRFEFTLLMSEQLMPTSARKALEICLNQCIGLNLLAEG